MTYGKFYWVQRFQTNREQGVPMAHGKYLWALDHCSQFWREVFGTELSLESLKRQAGIAANACYPNIWEAEVEGLQVL